MKSAADILTSWYAIEARVKSCPWYIEHFDQVLKCCFQDFFPIGQNSQGPRTCLCRINIFLSWKRIFASKESLSLFYIFHVACPKILVFDRRKFNKYWVRGVCSTVAAVSFWNETQNNPRFVPFQWCPCMKVKSLLKSLIKPKGLPTSEVFCIRQYMRWGISIATKP